MKKTLLLGAAALSVASAFATVDPATYEAAEGYTLTNKWIYSLFTNKAEFDALPFNESAKYARTACIANVNGVDKVIVGWSRTMVYAGPDGNDASDYFAHLVVMNMFTGAVEKVVQMTCDGNPIKGLLCANQVGCDQFGHVWFCGYVATPFNPDNGSYTPLRIYKVDDLDQGTCSVAAELTITGDEAFSGRIDYPDLIGDVTRTEAPCVVVTGCDASECAAYGWRCEQGSDEWHGLMSGGEYIAIGITSTYPADQTKFGSASTSKIVLDDDFTGDLFYLDAWVTCPTLYSSDGEMIDSFAAAVDFAPKVGTDGVTEFHFDNGDNFLFYSIEQYTEPESCRARVVKLGEQMEFDQMKEMWVFPAGGFGQLSDGGNRVHSVCATIYTDENDKQGAYLLTYKGSNGIAVYTMGQEGWKDDNGGVNDVMVDADANAPVQYFNLQGVAVSADNLTPGLYIKKQGNTVAKALVK